MTDECRWLDELRKHADQEFQSNPHSASVADIVDSIHNRLEQRQTLRMAFCLAGVLVFTAFMSWHLCGLDWKMSHTNWPAYTQYQQYQIGIGQ